MRYVMEVKVVPRARPNDDGEWRQIELTPEDLAQLDGLAKKGIGQVLRWVQERVPPELFPVQCYMRDNDAGYERK